MKRINRRSFLSKSTAMMAGAGIAGSGAVFSRENRYREQPQPAIREYRVLGRTGFKVSDIGCGFPGMANEGILKAALAGGINFIDTIEGHANGNSEVTVGRVLKTGSRDKLFINSKIAVTEKDTKETLVSRVRKSLERLETDYLDSLMLWHATSAKDTENKVFHSAVRQMKKEGIVRFSGVSCHGTSFTDEPPEAMDDVICSAVNSGRYDIVMFVYNYIQQDMGEKILECCEKNNVGSTLMKTDPFGGAYSIVTNMVTGYRNEKKEIPRNIQSLYDKIMQKQEAAMPFLTEHGLADVHLRREAAISFVLNNPAVSTVLISFSNFAEVADYINLSGSRLTERALSSIGELRDTFGPLYCRHACGICESRCPSGVPVNTIMRYNNYFTAQSREKFAMSQYLELKGPNASNCSSCPGFCESACPYGVPIHALLQDAHRTLSLG